MDRYEQTLPDRNDRCLELGGITDMVEEFDGTFEHRPGIRRYLVADKGYDKNALRERLHELKIRPLIKHRIFASDDHAHNARIDEERYAQRSMSETVNSAVKRSLGFAVRAREWYREFREITLMSVVYNIKRSMKQ